MFPALLEEGEEPFQSPGEGASRRGKKNSQRGPAKRGSLREVRIRLGGGVARGVREDGDCADEGSRGEFCVSSVKGYSLTG